MPFQKVTANALVGQQSGHATAAGFNGGSGIVANATGNTPVGSILAPMLQKKINVECRVDAAFGAGESSTLTLNYLNGAGVEVSIALGVLNATTAPAAGTVKLADALRVNAIPLGSVLYLANTYVAGTPAAPLVTAVVQAY